MHLALFKIEEPRVGRGEATREAIDVFCDDLAGERVCNVRETSRQHYRDLATVLRVYGEEVFICENNRAVRL